jgi:hypothetical protein
MRYVQGNEGRTPGEREEGPISIERNLLLLPEEEQRKLHKVR